MTSLESVAVAMTADDAGGPSWWDTVLPESRLALCSPTWLDSLQQSTAVPFSSGALLSCIDDTQRIRCSSLSMLGAYRANRIRQTFEARHTYIHRDKQHILTKVAIIQSWKLDQKQKAVHQLDNGLCYIMLVIDWCYIAPVYDTHAVMHLKVSKRLPAKDSPWCLSLSIDACVKLLCESIGCKDCHLFWCMAGTKILFVFGLYNEAENGKVHTYVRTYMHKQ